MGRLKRPTSLPFPRAFRVFRHCSGYVEQPKPLNTQGLSALFRVFNVLPARVTREPVTRAPAPYSFLPRTQGGEHLEHLERPLSMRYSAFRVPGTDPEHKPERHPCLT